MDCRAAGVWLSAELDGELSAAEAAALAEHVAGCPACARRRTVLEETWHAVVRLPLEPVSAGFDDAVRARVGRRGAGRWWLAAAAAVVVALLGPSLLREPRSVAPSASPTPRVAALADPSVGLDCGLPGATTCVADAAVVVLARPNVAFTSAQ